MSSRRLEIVGNALLSAESLRERIHLGEAEAVDSVQLTEDCYQRNGIVGKTPTRIVAEWRMNKGDRLRRVISTGFSPVR